MHSSITITYSETLLASRGDRDRSYQPEAADALCSGYYIIPMNALHSMTLWAFLTEMMLPMSSWWCVQTPDPTSLQSFLQTRLYRSRIQYHNICPIAVLQKRFPTLKEDSEEGHFPSLPKKMRFPFSRRDRKHLWDDFSLSREVIDSEAMRIEPRQRCKFLATCSLLAAPKGLSYRPVWHSTLQTCSAGLKAILEAGKASMHNFEAVVCILGSCIFSYVQGHPGILALGLPSVWEHAISSDYMHWTRLPTA